MCLSLKMHIEKGDVDFFLRFLTKTAIICSIDVSLTQRCSSLYISLPPFHSL